MLGMDSFFLLASALKRDLRLIAILSDSSGSPANLYHHDHNINSVMPFLRITSNQEDLHNIGRLAGYRDSDLYGAQIITNPPLKIVFKISH